MRKFSLVGLVMALCILFSCSLVQAQDLRTISVDGSSTIKVAPDKATISISIENTAKDAKLASAQNAQIMQNIQSAILGLAITKDKMQTTNYNLYPVYNQIVFSGKEIRISLIRDKTPSRFCSAKGSPPRTEIRLIYGLSISFINLFFAFSVHSLPPLKSQVSGLKQLKQCLSHP